MTTPISEIALVKSLTVSDGITNGGAFGYIPAISGAKNNLFPRVTKAETTTGKTRYRKFGFKSNDALSNSAYGVMSWIEIFSPGDDRFYIGSGTPSDVQGDWLVVPPVYVGCGKLQVQLNGGESAISVQMENNDFEFVPSGFIHIANKTLTGQTIASGILPGDSIELITGSWKKIAATIDIAYPKGIYLGNYAVFTIHSGTNEEFLQVKNKTYTEVIGTGDDTTTPTLTDLVNIDNGIFVQKDFLPVITVTSSGAQHTVIVGADGNCTGYCIAGSLDLETGEWITPIAFNGAITGDSDITITYTDKAWSYNANIVTVELESPVGSPYSTTTTYVSGCIKQDEVTTSFSDFSKVSVSGNYDIANYPLSLNNKGTIEDTWTFNFTSSTAFICTGLKTGNVGSGTITSSFSPTNPISGTEYFILNKDGFSGSFVAGDKLYVTTHMAVMPIICKQVIPAGAAPNGDNFCIFGFYWE